MDVALTVLSVVEVEVKAAFRLEMDPLITFVKRSRSLIIAGPGLVLSISRGPDMDRMDGDPDGSHMCMEVGFLIFHTPRDAFRDCLFYVIAQLTNHSSIIYV